MTEKFIKNFQNNFMQKTLHVVTIAMICSTLLHFENLNILGDLYKNQSDIYMELLLWK